MKLIVGLGNPGRLYIDSRHNIGISCVRRLSQFLKISLKKDKDTFSLNGKGKIKNQIVLLAMPLTFMNLSGLAVSAQLKKYKIGLENLLVVCDDLDLEFGRLRLRPRGCAGGHRGLQSIIDSLKSQEFSRLRIGIGRPKENIDAVKYVLSTFTKKEKEQIPEILNRACDCCLTWVTRGVAESMNIFNRKL